MRVVDGGRRSYAVEREIKNTSGTGISPEDEAEVRHRTKAIVDGIPLPEPGLEEVVRQLVINGDPDLKAIFAGAEARRDAAAAEVGVDSGIPGRDQVGRIAFGPAPERAGGLLPDPPLPFRNAPCGIIPTDPGTAASPMTKEDKAELKEPYSESYPLGSTGLMLVGEGTWPSGVRERFEALDRKVRDLKTNLDAVEQGLIQEVDPEPPATLTDPALYVENARLLRENVKRGKAVLGCYQTIARLRGEVTESERRRTEEYEATKRTHAEWDEVSGTFQERIREQSQEISQLKAAHREDGSRIGGLLVNVGHLELGQMNLETRMRAEHDRAESLVERGGQVVRDNAHLSETLVARDEALAGLDLENEAQKGALKTLRDRNTYLEARAKSLGDEVRTLNEGIAVLRRRHEPKEELS